MFLDGKTAAAFTAACVGTLFYVLSALAGDPTIFFGGLIGSAIGVISLKHMGHLD